MKESYNIIPGGIDCREAVKRACGRNSQVNDYLSRGTNNGKVPFSLRDNVKLKPILELLRKDPHITLVREHPIVLKWNPEASSNNHDSLIDKSTLSDVSDVSDVHLFDPPEKNQDIIKGNNLEYQEESITNITNITKDL